MMRNNEIGFLVLIMAAVVLIYTLDVICTEVKRVRKLPRDGKFTKGDAVAMLVWLSICLCIIWGLTAGGLRLMGVGK